MALELIRSLFNTYADLIISILPSFHFSMMGILFFSIDSKHSRCEEITSLFHNQIEMIYSRLINLSHDSCYFEQTKRTVILFRLLKCKWNRL
jgi:hypothetical protein